MFPLFREYGFPGAEPLSGAERDAKHRLDLLFLKSQALWRRGIEEQEDFVELAVTASRYLLLDTPRPERNEPIRRSLYPQFFLKLSEAIHDFLSGPQVPGGGHVEATGPRILLRGAPLNEETRSARVNDPAMETPMPES